MLEWDEDRVIPIDDVIRALQKLPYGNVHRCMMSMRFLTGCRNSELDNMMKSRIINGAIYWKKGKNQKGYRKEKLPDKFIEELKYMWQCNHTKLDAVFPITAETFMTQFNKLIRPVLGGKWLLKKPALFHNFARLTYIYQLSYLRKDFFTLDNANNYNRFKSLDVALYMTQKRMGHHCAYMTQAHYIQSWKSLDMDKYGSLSIQEIYDKEINAQMPLFEWL